MGKWLLDNPWSWCQEVICSNCHRFPVDDVRTPYCPWCGEKMTNSYLDSNFLKASDAVIEELLKGKED